MYAQAVMGVTVGLALTALVVALARRRVIPGSGLMVALVLSAVAFPAVSLVTWSAPDFATVRAAFLLSVPLSGMSAVLVLWYALAVTGRPTPLRVRLLLLEPLALGVVALLPGLDHLLAGHGPGPGHPTQVLGGGLLAVHALLAGGIASAGAILSLASQVGSVAGHRNRLTAVAVGLALPVPAAAVAVLAGAEGRLIDLWASVGVAGALVVALRVMLRPVHLRAPLAVHQVLAAIGDGVLVVDQDGVVVQANPAAVELLGLRVGGGAHQGLDLLGGRSGRALTDLLDAETVQVVLAGAGLVRTAGDRVLDVRTTPVLVDGAVQAGVVTVRDVTETEAMRAELAERAERDGLTGLHNRRHLDRVLPLLLGDAARTGRPLTAAMIDVDHFKRVNDAHGHAVGDAVLSAVAGVLAAQVRADDVVVRFGGEEIVVLLPSAGLAETVGRVEQCRRAVAATVIPAVPGGVRVTVSIGITEAAPGDDAAHLLQRADTAMYAAKAAGRNAVVMLDGGQPRLVGAPAAGVVR